MTYLLRIVRKLASIREQKWYCTCLARLKKPLLLPASSASSAYTYLKQRCILFWLDLKQQDFLFWAAYTVWAVLLYVLSCILWP